MALLSILLTGAISSTFALLESTERNRVHALLLYEGMFVQKRIASSLKITDDRTFTVNRGRLIENVSSGSFPLTDAAYEVTDFNIRMQTLNEGSILYGDVSFTLIARPSYGPEINESFYERVFVENQ